MQNKIHNSKVNVRSFLEERETFSKLTTGIQFWKSERFSHLHCNYVSEIIFLMQVTINFASTQEHLKKSNKTTIFWDMTLYTPENVGPSSRAV